MYTDAEQVIKSGNEGKWLKVSDEERDAIVRSIAGANMIRGAVAVGSGQGGLALRHYVRDGYIVVHAQGMEAEQHPNDKS